MNQNPKLETIAKPLKGSAKDMQFETVLENQEPGTSKSVEHNKTLVKVRLGLSTKEAFDKETKDNKVVKTMLLKGKCSAEDC